MENNKYDTEVVITGTLYGLKDKYGCVYSQDDKRFIICFNDIE